MPIGIITNCTVIIIGGVCGVLLQKYIPARIISALSSMFGIASIVIGVTLIVKFTALPAVILALILGTILGEALHLENRIADLSKTLKVSLEKWLPIPETKENDKYIEKFVNLLLLFCTGSTGLLGAMTEGMTSDPTIMLAKSVMDLFASGIFAASMGLFIIVIAIPQFLLFLCLFFLSEFILPFISPSMIGDFMSCGGTIALMTGLRMLEIKHLHVTNVLPALFFVMPISLLWAYFFG